MEDFITRHEHEEYVKRMEQEHISLPVWNERYGIRIQHELGRRIQHRVDGHDERNGLYAFLQRQRREWRAGEPD